VALETRRASADRKSLGEAFSEWGIPTAASLLCCAPAAFDTVFATGGIQSGLEIAKAIALGASAGGIARAALKALDQGGRAGAIDFLSRVERELQSAMLLTGSANVAALRRAPRILSGELRDWSSAYG